jgi:1,3-propanediol dehydrogenase/alcohol dehydrogenase
MKEFSLIFPPKVHFGCGSIEKLASAPIKGNKGLIITGKHSAKKSGLLARIKKLLRHQDKEVFVFDDVEPEVSVETVDRAAEHARRYKVDFILGLGGGSAIDCAKAAAGIYRDRSGVREYLDKKLAIRKEPGFFIAVPTTAGTGSEATKNAVLTYTEKKIKMSLRGEVLVPSLVILDPELTLGLPPDITAYTGMDALTHAVESYFSVNANEMTRPLSYRAIILITSSLYKAYRSGQDRQARYNMLLGSFTAGLAFANAGLGAVHGIGHPVGAVCKLPHGLVNAIMLPHIIGYNSRESGAGLKAFNEQAGFDLVKKIKALNKKMSIPPGLAKVCPDIASMTEEIISRVEYGASMAYNPVKMDEAKVREALKEAI